MGDEEKSGGRKNLYGALFLFLIVACSITMLATSGNDSPEPVQPTRFATAVPIPSVTVAPTDTAAVAAAPSATPVPPTSTPVPPTAVPSATITNTPLPTMVIPTDTATPTRVPDLEERASLISTTLNFATDLQISSVEIAPGRANGGENVAIVAYRSNAATENELGGEWGQIIGAAGSAIRENSMPVDSLSIIVGSATGQAEGIVTVAVSDINAFNDDLIDANTLFSRMSIESFDFSASSAGSSSSGSSGTTRRPDNCTDAVNMGLSAVEAAQWSHLDRDNDGVACYGD